MRLFVLFRKTLLALRWPVTLAVVSTLLWALSHGITVTSISLGAAALLIGLGWLLLNGRYWRWAFALALAGLLPVTGMNLWVYGVGHAHMVAAADARPAEAILVLGTLVNPDGTVSQVLADRLDTAYALYRAGKAPKLLLSGDHGQANYDEVNAMRRYLLAKGVPLADLFLDHDGFITYDSIYRARAVFAVHSAIVVTQAFHLPRALYMADRLGIASQGVASDLHQNPHMWFMDMRELGSRCKAVLQVNLGYKPLLGPVIPITGDGRQTWDEP